MAVLAAVVWGMHQKAQRLEDNNQVLVRERDEARLVLTNQQRTLQLISQISKAATNEKQQNMQHSEEQPEPCPPVAGNGACGRCACA